MIFLVLSGKMIFLFPENMVLPPGREMKDDLSSKNTWKFDIVFKCSEKMVFSKELHRNMIFLVLSGKMVFFPPKNDIVSLNGEIRGNMKFSVHRHRRHKRCTTPLCQKNQRWSCPAKKHLKVIDILTDILERVPVILCTFMETLVGVFMYCFPARKKPGNLIYRIET